MTPTAGPVQSDSHLEHLLLEAHEAVLEVDSNWRALYCNDVYLIGSGLAREAVIGRTTFEYGPNFTGTAQHAAAARCLETRRPEVCLSFAPLFQRWVEARVFPCKHGGMVLLSNTASDSAVERHVRLQMSQNDPLTSLPNKFGLDRDLVAISASGQAFSLALIGINGLRFVNGQLGPEYGDQALMQMASRMLMATSATDRLYRLYRLNSDIFALLCSGAWDDASARVQALVDATQEPIRLNGHEFAMGSAAGIAHSRGGKVDTEALIRDALAALRDAKQAGSQLVTVQATAGLGALPTPAASASRLELAASWVAVDCNDEYLSAVGLKRSEVVGCDPRAYLTGFENSIFYNSFVRCMTDREPTTMIGYSIIMGRWILSRNVPCAHGGLVTTAEEASDDVVRSYQNSRLLARDSLTGLPLKSVMADDMAMLLASGETASVAVIGLNRFKTVNEAQGFLRGDQVLMEMASRFLAVMADGDTLYRLHADMFAVLMSGSDEPALPRLERLMAVTWEPIELGGEDFVLGACAGIASAPHHGLDVGTLIMRASTALTRSKREHKPFVRFDSAMEDNSQRRVALEADLRRALVTGQLALYLQPKAFLQSGEPVLCGAEALIRWNHPVRGLVPPSEFLPLAQDCGLMPELDLWVLDEALLHIRRLHSQGLTTQVSINLSVESIGNQNLVAAVKDALERTGVPAHLLGIEIPEGAVMRDVGASAKVLSGLRDLGVDISIDDFGTGYSSFAYLARFQVAALKIDRAFVADMTRDTTGQTIVSGIIALAHAMALKVVAEGAETAEQVAMLVEMGCDEVQGYAYARPLTFDAFCAFSAESAQRTAHLRLVA